MTFHVFSTRRPRHLVLVSDVLWVEMKEQACRDFLDRADAVRRLGTMELKTDIALESLSQVDGCDVIRMELEP